jgi:hypothetical protein
MVQGRRKCMGEQVDLLFRLTRVHLDCSYWNENEPYRHNGDVKPRGHQI